MNKSPAIYQQRMIVGPSPKAVLAELRRRQQAGELHSAGPEIRPITQGAHAGQYAVPVYLRTVEQRRRPVWRAAAGILAGVLLLAALVWWVLTTLSGLALAALLLVVLALFSRRVARRHVTVTTTTTTRVGVR